MTLPALGLLFFIRLGPDSGESSDFQPFMNIFADQMRYLYQSGVEDVFDGSHQ